MAIIYCQQCDRYTDTDTVEVHEGPDGGLWCHDCYTEYENDMDKLEDDHQPDEAQEWFDFDPDC